MSKWMYGLITGRMAGRDIVDVWPQAQTYGLECDRKTVSSLAVPQLLFPYSRVALIEIELMIGVFTIFKVMEP